MRNALPVTYSGYDLGMASLSNVSLRAIGLVCSLKPSPAPSSVGRARRSGPVSVWASFPPAPCLGVVAATTGRRLPERWRVLDMPLA